MAQPPASFHPSARFPTELQIEIYSWASLPCPVPESARDDPLKPTPPEVAAAWHTDNGQIQYRIFGDSTIDRSKERTRNAITLTHELEVSIFLVPATMMASLLVTA